jgi:flagellar biosynthesis GTPase FlhF
MKLYRFTASTTPKAIMMVKEALGSNALIYSTRKVVDGTEILAGMPFVEEDAIFEEEDRVIEKNNKNKKDTKMRATKLIEPSFDNKMLESFRTQLEVMNETLQALTLHMNDLQEVVAAKFQKRQLNWKLYLFSWIIYLKDIYERKTFSR